MYCKQKNALPGFQFFPELDIWAVGMGAFVPVEQQETS